MHSRAVGLGWGKGPVTWEMEQPDLERCGSSREEDIGPLQTVSSNRKTYRDRDRDWRLWGMEKKPRSNASCCNRQVPASQGPGL